MRAARAVQASLLVLLIALAPLAAGAKEPAAGAAAARPAPPAGALTEIAALDGTDYRIDVPADWNRGLVVFFHGYAVEPVAFREGDRRSPMFEPLLAAGYAVIQSAYSATGWAVEQGSADSERLRRRFVAKFGRPRRTYAMGLSMGGTLTAMAVETQPEVYDGALSLCGVLEPTDRFMQRDFALRAAFDYYFPDLLGPLAPPPPEALPGREPVQRIAAALRGDPRAYAALHVLYGAADERSLPGVLAFITYEVREMQQRARGNPFDNADFVYTGTGDDAALNDGVKRYRAEPRAAAYLSRWYTPTGRLTRPLLALHDSGDPLVPASSAYEYALLARRAGRADRFVQQYVGAEGHCVFSPGQVGRAFGELADWVEHGRRPAPGRLPER